MKNKRFKSALSLLLVLLLCFSVMAPSFAAQTVDLAATGDGPPVVEWHANSGTTPSATVSESDVQAVFEELVVGSGTYYGIKAASESSVTNLSGIISRTKTVYAGAYTIYRTASASLIGTPRWNNGTAQDITVKLYYNANFAVNGTNEGEIFLNGEPVSSEVKLYPGTEYTVTAKAVEGYTCTISGATEGEAFQPKADMNITAVYTPDVHASVSLNVTTGDGTAQVLVNGEDAHGVVPVGGFFSVETNPNTDKGYALDSIVVTKNGDEIEANGDGSYGPAANGDEFAVSVTFKFDPKRVDINVDANKGTVSRSDIIGFFSGSYSYYGIAKEANGPVENLINLIGYENSFEVEDREYFIYATNDDTGLIPQPVWDNAKLMILNVKTYYTVTWKNYDGTELASDHVYNGATPSYSREIPVRPEDMNNTYTFSAWDDGKTTYLIGVDDLPPVTGDVTYTAVFTAETKPLFAAHSVTLGGDIGVNFYIDGNIAGVADAQTAVVKFAWDGGNYIKEVNLKELVPDEKGWYKATVNVVAAQMAHRIEAVAYINGNMIYTADLYSVQEYAKAVYDDPEKYDDKGKPDELKALAAAMLHYGSEAQTVFADALTVKPDRADSVITDDPADYTGVTADAVAEAINGPASDLNGVATQLGAKYYTNSLIYLQNNTLRLYFTPNEYGQAMPNADAYAGSQSNNYYYYAEKTNIPAAELDDQQEFTVGDVKFYFSPLDYVEAVLSSSKMTEAQKNLAASLFLYNQAANAYFDEA